jgi:hypothetical protein
LYDVILLVCTDERKIPMPTTYICSYERFNFYMKIIQVQKSSDGKKGEHTEKGGAELTEIIINDNKSQ